MHSECNEKFSVSVFLKLTLLKNLKVNALIYHIKLHRAFWMIQQFKKSFSRMEDWWFEIVSGLSIMQLADKESRLFYCNRSVLLILVNKAKYREQSHSKKLIRISINQQSLAFSSRDEIDNLWHNFSQSSSE